MFSYIPRYPIKKFFQLSSLKFPHVQHLSPYNDCGLSLYAEDDVTSTLKKENAQPILNEFPDWIHKWAIELNLSHFQSVVVTSTRCVKENVILLTLNWAKIKEISNNTFLDLILYKNWHGISISPNSTLILEWKKTYKNSFRTKTKSFYPYTGVEGDDPKQNWQCCKNAVDCWSTFLQFFLLPEREVFEFLLRLMGALASQETSRCGTPRKERLSHWI